MTRVVSGCGHAEFCAGICTDWLDTEDPGELSEFATDDPVASGVAVVSSVAAESAATSDPKPGAVGCMWEQRAAAIGCMRPRPRWRS